MINQKMMNRNLIAPINSGETFERPEPLSFDSKKETWIDGTIPKASNTKLFSQRAISRFLHFYG